jgi:hypothetical protein
MMMQNDPAIACLDRLFCLLAKFFLSPVSGGAVQRRPMARLKALLAARSGCLQIWDLKRVGKAGLVGWKMVLKED